MKDIKRKLFTAPLVLKAETDDYFEVGGIASTEDTDLQNEIIKQEGLDLSLLRERRIVFNDDHSKETKDILGIVEEAVVTSQGLKVKGKIFKNNPAGMTYYNLLKHGGYVGYSVEGAVQRRDRENSNIISNAKLSAIALTRNPVNQATYATFLKSLTGEVELTDEEFEPTLESKIDKAIDLLQDLLKGGMGSGRKKTALDALDDEQEESRMSADDKDKENREDQEEKEITVQVKDEEDEGGKKEKKDRSEQKREEMKQEIKLAHENLRGGELKEKIAEIKRKFFGDKERKRQEDKKQVTPKIGGSSTKKSISKAELQNELIRRAKQNPDFAKALQKALTSGGPAYSDTLIGDFTGGQVFQMEGREKKKKKKKKIEKYIDYGTVL